MEETKGTRHKFKIERIFTLGGSPSSFKGNDALFKWRVLLAMELGLYWFDLYFLSQLKNLCSACSEFTLRSKQWRSPFHVVSFYIAIIYKFYECIQYIWPKFTKFLMFK